MKVSIVIGFQGVWGEDQECWIQGVYPTYEEAIKAQEQAQLELMERLAEKTYIVIEDIPIGMHGRWDIE